MIFTELGLAGAYLVQPESIRDDRGAFTRTYCADEFALRGLVSSFAQCSVSCNSRAGTLRGLHYQTELHGEVKLIRCGRGAIYDVIVDIRPDSPTWGKWAATTLSAENGRQVYAPQGFAHGFQALEDDSEVCYQISTRYVPAAARGIRWNDPSLDIPWPIADPIVSSRDNDLPPLIWKARRSTSRLPARGYAAAAR